MIAPKLAPSTSRAVVVALIITTAAIHFSRAAADPEIRVLFILNGLGYLGLGAMLFAPPLQRWQRWVRWALIGYTGLTVALYILWGAMSGDWVMPIGPIDKLVEIALIGLLWQTGRMSVVANARI
jgi:hypothetical protein